MPNYNNFVSLNFLKILHVGQSAGLLKTVKSCYILKIVKKREKPNIPQVGYGYPSLITLF